MRVRWDGAGTVSTTPVPSGNGAGDGRAYLMARVAEERRRRALEARAESIAGQIHAAFGIHAADRRLEILPSDWLLMSAAYLVDRERVDHMVAQVRATAEEHPDLEVLCTGPWPPYSFADGEDTHAD